MSKVIKLVLVAVALLLLSGWRPGRVLVYSTEQDFRGRLYWVTPCDTDSDCAEKNPHIEPY